MRATRPPCAFLLLASLGAAPAPPAKPSPAPPARPIPLPGGIADPAGRTGFVTSAAGGIDAVDLKTGELLWDTNEAQRPLLVVGSRLVAQAGVKRNRLRILVFDLTDHGECVLESDPVVLPGWVVTGNAPGRSFETCWRLARNQLVLGWEASAWYAGTTRPTAQQEAAARKSAAGVARIDLETGRVELGPAEKAEPEAVPAPVRPLEKLAVRWHGVLAGRPSALIMEESDGQQALVLRSWEPGTGKAAGQKEVLRGRRLLAQRTLDGHFLCLRDSGPIPDGKALAQGAKVTPWTLFSLELGGPVGTMPYEAGTQDIAVVGARAYYAVSGPVRGPLDRPLVQPRTLKALDLKTGKVVWERAVAGKQLAPPVR
jgi:hypothetical protein